MSEITTSILSILSNNTPIKSAVKKRIYTSIADQKAQLPYIVMTEISTEFTSYTMAVSDHQRSLVQVDVYADSSSDVESISNDVIKALSIQRGVYGLRSIVSSTPEIARRLDETSTLNDGEKPVRRNSIDFSISHTKV